jgi:hypothetical protein
MDLVGVVSKEGKKEKKRKLHTKAEEADFDGQAHMVIDQGSLISRA